MTQYELTLALNRIIMEHSEFTTWTVSTPHLMMLIKEVIEKEREACAKVCDQNHFAVFAADAIRARGVQ